MSDFYVQEVLKGMAASAMRWQKKNGPPSAIKLLPDMSQAVFQQDGAPAHNATKTQKWCQVSISVFWAKGVRPGNSPDLSPIENLCAIVQHKVDKMATATSEVNLIRMSGRPGAALHQNRWTTRCAGCRSSWESVRKSLAIISTYKPRSRHSVFLILQAIEGLINFGTPCNGEWVLNRRIYSEKIDVYIQGDMPK